MADQATAAQFKDGLARLAPQQPWTHHFEVDGVHTISPEADEKFFRKATGLKRLGNLATTLAKTFSLDHTIAGKRVIDVACGEGGHSVAFAQEGAGEVVGVEGRELYVDRARFVSEAMGLTNVNYQLGDVRALSLEQHGAFDICLCFGILHHLGQDDFFPFLQSLADITTDTAIFYTHVSNPTKLESYGLQGPVTSNGEYEGYLFREHADGASEAERRDQVRASLDNTFSFWATDEALMRALKRAGFAGVMKVYEPHVFGDYQDRNFRQVMIAKKQLVT